MNFEATIKKVGEVRQGTNDYGQWVRRDVILTLTEVSKNNYGAEQTYEHDIIVTLSGTAASDFALEAGTYVSVGVNFSVREWGGRDYQSINCYRMVPIG